MVRSIMKDKDFLSRPSEPAVESDMWVGLDLLDTLKENKAECVGIAANMIGVSKRIIAVECEDESLLLMYNPEIIKKSGLYETEEGCLSLEGVRKTKRYKSIKLQYLNDKFQQRIKTFTGFTAQVIQHEIDHCNGVLI